MKLGYVEGATLERYQERARFISERVRQLGWECAELGLDVEVDSMSVAIARGRHTIWISDGVAIEAFVLTKEEFQNLHGAFDHCAMRKARAAIGRLRALPEQNPAARRHQEQRRYAMAYYIAA